MTFSIAFSRVQAQRRQRKRRSALQSTSLQASSIRLSLASPSTSSASYVYEYNQMYMYVCLYIYSPSPIYPLPLPGEIKLHTSLSLAGLTRHLSSVGHTLMSVFGGKNHKLNDFIISFNFIYYIWFMCQLCVPDISVNNFMKSNVQFVWCNAWCCICGHRLLVWRVAAPYCCPIGNLWMRDIMKI